MPLETYKTLQLLIKESEQQNQDLLTALQSYNEVIENIEKATEQLLIDNQFAESI